MRNINVGNMLQADGVTKTLTASGQLLSTGRAIVGARTFHQVLSGSGALTCSYTIDASNDNGNTWISLYANPGFNGAGPKIADAFSVGQNQAWLMFRVNVISITGTNASLQSFVGEQMETEA